MVERLGRAATVPEWTAIIGEIVERRAVVLAETGATLVYAAALGGVVVTVVWDPECAVVVTVLPQSGRVSPHTEGTGGKRIRASLHYPGGWSRGRRLKARTVWRDG